MHTIRAAATAILSICLLMVAKNAFAQPGHWDTLAGCATSIAAGPAPNQEILDYWVIGCDPPNSEGRSIYEFNQTTHQFDQRAGRAISVNVCPVNITHGPCSVGQAWAINNVGHILRYLPGSSGFVDFPVNYCDGSGPVLGKVSSLGKSYIASNSILWVVDSTGAVVQIPSCGNRIRLPNNRVADEVITDANQGVWARDTFGLVYKLTNAGQFVPVAQNVGLSLTGFPFSFGVDLLGTDFNVYTWFNNSWALEAFGPPSSFRVVQIAGKAAITADGTIWCRCFE